MIVATDAQLAHANLNAPEGDTITLVPRAWSTPLAPARPGITYMARGSSIPPLTITRDRTVVIGTTVRGSLTVENCTRVEVRQCSVMGDDLRANQMLWLIRNVSRAFFSEVYSFARLSSVSECRGRFFYGLSDSLVQDCETVIEYAGANVGEQFVHNVRDRSVRNAFQRDVIRAGLNSPREWARNLHLASSGSYETTCHGNVYRDCRYETTGLIYLQEIVQDWRLERCQFKGSEIRTNRVERFTATGCRFETRQRHAFIEDGGGQSSGEMRDCVFVSAHDPGYGIGSAGLKVVNATSERPPVEGG